MQAAVEETWGKRHMTRAFSSQDIVKILIIVK
jgi:hypothetical protein